MGSKSRFAVVALSLWAAVLAGGCKGGGFRLIDHIAVEPAENLESIRIALVFSNNIHSDLSGSFLVGNYGFLFVNPFTPAEPFEIGFNLDTDIVNDQDYVELTPTEVLPNGNPIGIGYALAEIRGVNPVGPKFDLFAYVDILKGSWLGAAAIFSFINDQYFPNGLTISQVFMRGQDGSPGVIASVFGPTVDSSGKMTRAGGLAVFANVKQLIEEGKQGRYAKRTTYRAAQLPTVSGERAPEYQGQYTKLQHIESNLVRAFNGQKAQ